LFDLAAPIKLLQMLVMIFNSIQSASDLPGVFSIVAMEAALKFCVIVNQDLISDLSVHANLPSFRMLWKAVQHHLYGLVQKRSSLAGWQEFFFVDLFLQMAVDVCSFLEGLRSHGAVVPLPPESAILNQFVGDLKEIRAGKNFLLLT